MWKPSIRRGIIGQKQPGKPPASTVEVAYGSSLAAQPNDTTYDHDEGRAKHYVNPHGFPGLNGFELGKAAFAKNQNWRNPRAGTGRHFLNAEHQRHKTGGIYCRPDEPFLKGKQGE